MITVEEEKKLFDLRKNVNDDNIRIKEIIKEKIITSNMLIHILETPGLNEDCPEEYIGKSILPAVLIPDIQYEVKN